MAFDAHWYFTDNDMALSQLVRIDWEGNAVHLNLDWDSGWLIGRYYYDWTNLSSDYGAPTSDWEDQWLRFTVHVQGNQMRVFLNGSQVLPSSGWTYIGNNLQSGYLGFQSYIITGWNDDWFIDDVNVRRLVEPEPTVILGSDPQCP